jgi:hypothetical protein
VERRDGSPIRMLATIASLIDDGLRDGRERYG